MNLTREQILNSFNDKRVDNFPRYNIGIITSDRDKVEKIIADIFENNKGVVDRYINSKNEIRLRLKNGDNYIWIKPIPNARGHRLKSAYIDKNIDLDIFEDIIIPICAYCSKDDIKVI